MRGSTEKQTDSCVVVGCSAGGMAALRVVFSRLGGGLAVPIVVVQHLHPSMRKIDYAQIFEVSSIPITEARDKAPLEPGCIYFAPANYHLLIERKGTFALNDDDPVNFSRPSIDVLFLSAAKAYGAGTVAVVLSGANSDGQRGVEAVLRAGGTVLVQDPNEAECPEMPRRALEKVSSRALVSLADVANCISKLNPKSTGDCR